MKNEIKVIVEGETKREQKTKGWFRLHMSETIQYKNQVFQLNGRDYQTG